MSPTSSAYGGAVALALGACVAAEVLARGKGRKRETDNSKEGSTMTSKETIPSNHRRMVVVNDDHDDGLRPTAEEQTPEFKNEEGKKGKALTEETMLPMIREIQGLLIDSDLGAQTRKEHIASELGDLSSTELSEVSNQHMVKVHVMEDDGEIVPIEVEEPRLNSDRETFHTKEDDKTFNTTTAVEPSNLDGAQLASEEASELPKKYDTAFLSKKEDDVSSDVVVEGASEISSVEGKEPTKTAEENPKPSDRRTAHEDETGNHLKEDIIGTLCAKQGSEHELVDAVNLEIMAEASQSSSSDCYSFTSETHPSTVYSTTSSVDYGIFSSTCSADFGTSNVFDKSLEENDEELRRLQEHVDRQAMKIRLLRQSLSRPPREEAKVPEDDVFDDGGVETLFTEAFSNDVRTLPPDFPPPKEPKSSSHNPPLEKKKKKKRTSLLSRLSSRRLVGKKKSTAFSHERGSSSSVSSKPR